MIVSLVNIDGVTCRDAPAGWVEAVCIKVARRSRIAILADVLARDALSRDRLFLRTRPYIEVASLASAKGMRFAEEIEETGAQLPKLQFNAEE